MENKLFDCLQIILWLFTYISIAFIIYKKNKFIFPIINIVLNLAWEITSIITNNAKEFILILHILWIIIGICLLIFYFKYLIKRKNEYIFILLLIINFVILFSALSITFNILIDILFTINLFTSLIFIINIFVRKYYDNLLITSLRTIANIFIFIFYHSFSMFILFLSLLTVIIDIIYLSYLIISYKINKKLIKLCDKSIS